MQVDFSYFTVLQRRSVKSLSNARPLLSILILDMLIWQKIVCIVDGYNERFGRYPDHWNCCRKTRKLLCKWLIVECF